MTVFLRLFNGDFPFFLLCFIDASIGLLGKVLICQYVRERSGGKDYCAGLFAQEVLFYTLAQLHGGCRHLR
jgi:hypothetical protein